MLHRSSTFSSQAESDCVISSFCDGVGAGGGGVPSLIFAIFASLLGTSMSNW